MTAEQIKSLYTDPVSDSLITIVDEIDSDKIDSAQIDALCDSVVKVMNTASENIPSAKFCKHTKPFWNKELKRLKKIKVIKFHEWVKAGRPRDPGNIFWQAHKSAKKAFSKEIRKVSKQYENDQILTAIQKAEVDRNFFWKMLKKCRKEPGVCVSAVRNQNEKVVYDTDEVLAAWKTHFESICTPKLSEKFDNAHFLEVNESVRSYDSMDDIDDFSKTKIEQEEVLDAVGKLHCRKAPGHDNISAEHIKHAGPILIYVLTFIFNLIMKFEYVPSNMRKGIQVPLYKGKNLCYLNMDNHRGITLLSSFNKVFEMVIWNRIRKWWDNEGIVSSLQGACRRGQSCILTAFLLQETVSCALDNSRNVFVAYYDVSKAFDSVLTNGLFYKLYSMGIKGRLWRILYRAYIGFKCRVRIGGSMSNWYDMGCGIHQGGFLSLVKYTAFINELITQLEKSGLCCDVYGIPSSPPGYADDLATACKSKIKLDMALQIVNDYGNKWRFAFNARKSAVMVYGEGKQENLQNSQNRIFKLGNDRVFERNSYDHVGVKACLFTDDESRVKEKICKGRRALNASAGLGIRKNGLTLKTCSLIYWNIVVPIITFGCEIWYVSERL